MLSIAMSARKRILVVHPGALGDVLLSLPAIAGLRRSFPEAFVEVVGQPRIMALLHGRYYADSLCSIDAGHFHTLFIEEPYEPLIRRLSSFDLILSWFGSQDAIYTATLRRIAARSIIEKPVPPEGGCIHAIDYLISTLHSLGITVEDRIPRLYLTVSDRAYARGFFQRAGIAGDGRLVLALHPSSGSPKKCWSADRFADLAAHLINRLDAQILLIQGPADAAPAEQVVRQVNHPRMKMLSGLSTVQLASVLERCSGFIGHDSGVTHLAAAVGIKVLALFGPTDPAVWGPRGAFVTTVHTDLATLTVDAVLNAMSFIRA